MNQLSVSEASTLPQRLAVEVIDLARQTASVHRISPRVLVEVAIEEFAALPAEERAIRLLKTHTQEPRPCPTDAARTETKPCEPKDAAPVTPEMKADARGALRARKKATAACSRE